LETIVTHALAWERKLMDQSRQADARAALATV